MHWVDLSFVVELMDCVVELLLCVVELIQIVVELSPYVVEFSCNRCLQYHVNFLYNPKEKAISP